MQELPRFDSQTLSPDYRFVRVVSREGVFYDLVRKWRSREHVFRMQQNHLAAETVSRSSVPPCVFRDFTELNGQDVFRECVWKNGTRKFFPQG